MEFIRKIKENLFLRNLILALCALIILIFAVQMILNWSTRHGKSFEVPDLHGMTIGEAEAVSGNAKLVFEVNDSLYLPRRSPGIILEQNPLPGAKVKSGRRVFVTVNSFNPKTAVIPYVTDFSLRQAKNNLEIAQFEIEKLIYRDDIASNYVLEQQYQGTKITPQSNIQAPTGSGVVLIVGKRPGETVRLPRTVGFGLREAKSRLWEQGFNVGKVTYGDGITEINLHEAKVHRQMPGAGTVHPLGTSVDLYLTLDDKEVAEGQKEADQSLRRAASTPVTTGEEVSPQDSVSAE